jgi:hypothetical protein
VQSLKNLELETWISKYPVPLPNFLIIGAMKAGTSALYLYLDQHPEVYMSPVKEPNFFAFEGEDLDFQAPMDRQGINATSVTDLEAYRRLFEGVTDEKAVGEASHWYLYWPGAAERIQYHIPEVRLIAMLRNPVERAYSEYLHFVRDGHESYENFGRALDAEEERIAQNWAMGRYADRGFYYEQLKRYFDRFDEDQIRIYLHDDFTADSLAVVRDVYRFIGVDPGFRPDISRRPNPSGLPKNKLLHYVMNPSMSWQKQLIKRLPDWMRRIGSRLRSRNLEKPPLLAQHRRRLTDLYREDVHRLEELIDRDLSMWLSGDE